MPSRRRFLASTSVLTGALAGCSALGVGSRETWRVELGEQFVQSPLVHRDGTIYATSGDGMVHAVDRQSGASQWSQQMQEGFFTGPALVEDHLVVGFYDLLTIDLGADGTWDLGWWLELFERGREVSAISIREETIVVGDDHGTVHGITRRDPHPIWEGSVGDSRGIVESIAPVGDQLLAVSATDDTGYVTALSAEDGTRRWHRQFPALTQAVPAGDVVLAAHREGVTAVEIGTGEGRWTRSLDDAVANDRAVSLTVTDGRAYVVGETPPTPTVTALSLPDGSQQWQADLGGASPHGVAPTVADGLVYVPEGSSHRISAFTTDGDAAWTYRFEADETPMTKPLVVDGTIVVGLDEALVAVRT